jgi:hypothetical protein
MALDHHGFDPSTLVYWRKRLAKSERPHRINDAVRQVVEETGILRGRRKRAVDSTIVPGAHRRDRLSGTRHHPPDPPDRRDQLSDRVLGGDRVREDITAGRGSR